MSSTSSAAWAAFLLVICAPFALAQSPPTPSAERADQAHAPSKGRSANGASYSSAFEGYRRFSDQPVGSWRQANDTVRQIGGWQAYAREAQAAEDTAPAPGADSKAPASSAPRDHAGHH